MKKLCVKYLNVNKLLLILILIISFALFNQTSAQAKRNGGGRGERGVPHVSHNSPGWGGIHHGSYFAPRVGARFSALPRGYDTFWFGGFPYYYYDGFWFQYYPAYDYYVVVNKPEGADEVQNLKFDQIKLTDGSTIQGIFEGATDSMVTVKVGDKNLDLNIGDISSITFAPAIQDTTAPVIQDTTQQK